MTIGKTLGERCKCGKWPPPQYFFYLKIVFFWLLIWTGVNKKLGWEWGKRVGVYIKNGCKPIFLLCLTLLLRKSLTHLLNPCSRVLLEKITGLKVVKKFPAFYGTRRFITSFTSAHHLSLSWTTSIQSMLLHPTSWRSILILSSHLGLDLPSRLFPSGFPHTCYMPLPYHYSRFHHPNNIGWGIQVIKLLIMSNLLILIFDFAPRPMLLAKLRLWLWWPSKKRPGCKAQC